MDIDAMTSMPCSRDSGPGPSGAEAGGKDEVGQLEVQVEMLSTELAWLQEQM